MKQRGGALFFVCMILICGVLIYTATRTESLYINQWFTYLAGASVLDFCQGLVRNSVLPAWVIYSLPDALWMLALVTFVLLIWDFKLHSRSVPWLILSVGTGLLFEIFQGVQLVPGTFDLIDIATMLIAALVPLFLVTINRSRCAKN